MMHGDDIVWVRSLSGYRLGVLLPKGFSFISSNVAAQLTTAADGRLKLAFANPSGQSNPVTIHAHKTAAAFPPQKFNDMFFDDIKTLYDLDAPESGVVKVDQSYSDYRKGDKAALDALTYLPLQDLKVTDLDTAKAFTPAKEGNKTVVKLEVPIVDEKQSAHIRITGTIKDPGYKSRTAISCSIERCMGCAIRFCSQLDGRSRRIAVGHDRHLSGPRVRRAHQLERREQLQRHDPRAQTDVMRRAALVAIVLAAVATGWRRNGAGEVRRYESARPPTRRTTARSASAGSCSGIRPTATAAGWSVDYPRADQNLTFRLSELTKIIVSRDIAGQYNHLVIPLTDAELYRCPFIMMTEPGGAYFDADEAVALRGYLERGGFLWADDFWGDYAFEHLGQRDRKALPPYHYPIVDLPISHPIFHMLYDMKRVPQIPSINFWGGTGGQTSERGAGSAVPHVRAIFDESGRMMVLMTHNTDFGDAFEREGDDHRILPHLRARRLRVRCERAALRDDALSRRLHPFAADLQIEPVRILHVEAVLRVDARFETAAL